MSLLSPQVRTQNSGAMPSSDFVTKQAQMLDCWMVALLTLLIHFELCYLKADGVGVDQPREDSRGTL